MIDDMNFLITMLKVIMMLLLIIIIFICTYLSSLFMRFILEESKKINEGLR